MWGSIILGKPGGPLGDELLTFRGALVEKIREFQPRHVWYMAPQRFPHDDQNKLQRKFGLAAVIELVVAGLRAQGEDVRVGSAEDQTVVARFTGRARWGGTAKKKAAVIEVCLRNGWDVGDDNDAGDALALLWLAEHRLAPKLAAQRPLVLTAL